MAKHPNSGIEFDAGDPDRSDPDDGTPKANGPAFPGHGEPLAEAGAAQRRGPSAAQHAWLQAHPNYMQASHFFGRMVERGTLHEDGSFIPETKTPAMDGPSCFTVGIPLRR